MADLGIVSYTTEYDLDKTFADYIKDLRKATGALDEEQPPRTLYSGTTSSRAWKTSSAERHRYPIHMGPCV